VKRISHDQSRRNSGKRKRKVKARHGRAGRWSPQAQPMLNTGKVHYEIGANMAATGFGGIAAAHQLVTKLGLPGQIDSALELLKVHLPYHESDHVLNIAYNVLRGCSRIKRCVAGLCCA
jgi:hypothetical protein